jgi:hypothetical protein
MTTMDMSLLAYALIFALAFANGANDVSKAIATLVGSEPKTGTCRIPAGDCAICVATIQTVRLNSLPSLPPRQNLSSASPSPNSWRGGGGTDGSASTARILQITSNSLTSF